MKKLIRHKQNIQHNNCASTYYSVIQYTVSPCVYRHSPLMPPGLTIKAGEDVRGENVSQTVGSWRLTPSGWGKSAFVAYNFTAL